MERTMATDSMAHAPYPLHLLLKPFDANALVDAVGLGLAPPAEPRRPVLLPWVVTCPA